MHFKNFILTILFKNAKIEYHKKKKKKKRQATHVFQNFGSVGKGQANTSFFLGLSLSSCHFEKLDLIIWVQSVSVEK